MNLPNTSDECVPNYRWRNGWPMFQRDCNVQFHLFKDEYIVIAWGHCHQAESEMTMQNTNQMTWVVYTHISGKIFCSDHADSAASKPNHCPWVMFTFQHFKYDINMVRNHFIIRSSNGNSMALNYSLCQNVIKSSVVNITKAAYIAMPR